MKNLTFFRIFDNLKFFDYQIEFGDHLHEEILINKSMCFWTKSQYYFSNDHFYDLNDFVIRDSLTKKYIDMGFYGYLRSVVFELLLTLNCFDEDCDIYIGHGYDGVFLKSMDRGRVALIENVISNEEENLSRLVRGCVNSGAVFWSTIEQLSSGNLLKIDECVYFFISNWMKFMYWIDDLYKKYNCEFKITIADKNKWKEFQWTLLSAMP